MANRILEFIVRARDDASKTIDGVKAKTVEANASVNGVDANSKKAVQSVSKVAQIIKSTLTGNVTEATRSIAEMGGKWASFAAGAAVATTAVMAWVAVFKKLIALRAAEYIYEIQAATNVLSGSIDRANVMFARQDALLKRNKESADAYRSAQEKIRGVKNEIAGAQVEGVRAQMLAGTDDPIRQAKINAAADAELAAQKIRNEQAILAEQRKRHDDEVAAIQLENKKIDEQSAKRNEMHTKAVVLANEMADAIGKRTVGVGNVGYEFGDTASLLAEQDKAIASADRLLSEQNAANQKKLDNQNKLDKLKNDDAVFQAEAARIDALADKEKAVAEKTQAEILVMQVKADEEAAKKKKEIADKSALDAATAGLADADQNMADVNATSGTAARDRMKAEAAELRKEAARGFTKDDLEQKVKSNRDEVLRKREAATMTRKAEGYEAYLKRIGGDANMGRLSREMQASIMLERERKGKIAEANAKEAAALVARKKFEDAADAQIKSKDALVSIEQKLKNLGAGA